VFHIDFVRWRAMQGWPGGCLFSGSVSRRGTRFNVDSVYVGVVVMFGCCWRMPRHAILEVFVSEYVFGVARVGKA